MYCLVDDYFFLLKCCIVMVLDVVSCDGFVGFVIGVLIGVDFGVEVFLCWIMIVLVCEFVVVLVY